MSNRKPTSLAAIACLTAALGGCSSPNAPSDAAVASGTASAGNKPGAAEAEALQTSAGAVEFHAVHHATVWFEAAGKVVWVDPWSEGKLDGPKADLILVSDIHPDHFDQAGIDKVKKADTKIVGPQVVADKLPGTIVMKNGDSHDEAGFHIEAIPMYNLKRGPEEGKLFHDKGRGNGYVVTVGGKRVYFSGDTECTDEMKSLKDIDLAFVCMNLPYTMPPSEAAECVKAFKPKVLVPYHYKGQNVDELKEPLSGSGTALHTHDFYR